MGAMTITLEELAKMLDLSQKVVEGLVDREILGQRIGDKIRVRPEDVDDVKTRHPGHNWNETGFSECFFAEKRWFLPEDFTIPDFYVKGSWPGVWCRQRDGWCTAKIDYKHCGTYEEFQDK